MLADGVAIQIQVKVANAADPSQRRNRATRSGTISTSRAVDTPLNSNKPKPTCFWGSDLKSAQHLLLISTSQRLLTPLQTHLPPIFTPRERPHRFRALITAILIGLCATTYGQQPASWAKKPPVDQHADQTVTAYLTDKPTLEKGEQLFQNNCSACHNFRQKGIGPNLGGVTSAVSADWLKKFIRNAPAMISSGDARATRLFEEYKQVMPAFPTLKDSDVDAILAYVHRNQKRESTPTADPNALSDPIPAKIAPSGLRLLLEEVTTAPASAEKVPKARINTMLVLPGATGRLFIQDLRGTLYELVDNKLRVYMDMTKERPAFIPAPGLASGLGSYAFHPDFYKNGLFYTTHTEKAHTAPADFAYADSIKVTLQWVLTEWKLPDPKSSVFAGTGRELMRVNMVSSIHGMQEITFNPKARPGTPDYGLLYIGVGDGGATENGFYFICNDKTHIWSSVLRIDPQGRTSKNGHYGIPASNPYARNNDPATAREVFCRGFRNPNRICWAPDGKMLIADIGHANAEEVNLGVAGADYGWPEREGNFAMHYRGKMDKVYPLPEDDRAFRYTYPVAIYDHDEGNAISGGFVYSGTDIPLLTGKYVFGDIVNGRVFYVESSQLKIGQQAPIQEMTIQVGGNVTTFQALSGSKKTDLRFGLGLGNALYLYTKTDGKIYKVTGCSAQ